MEGSVALTLDCEDMFKEITKKLYGEEAGVGGEGQGEGEGGGEEFPLCERDGEDEDAEELRPEEQLTAWGLAALMQGGFPPPGILAPNFAPRTDPAAEDRWSQAEEPLAWAHSRVAAYNPAQRLFKCAECECVGFLARVAEHWLGAHSQARAFACPLPGCAFAAAWARLVRRHLARDHRRDPRPHLQLLQDNPALQDLTRYLQRLKARVDLQQQQQQQRPAPPAEAPEPPAPAAPAPPAADKRYACAECPYATDRRDLFSRHAHIHRDDKPFHCYHCRKPFNRADHVKKHFLRMHRDQPYDLNRIRRVPDKPAPAPQQLPPLPALQQAPPPLVALGAPPSLYYAKAPPAAAAAAEFAPPPVKLERPPPAPAPLAAPPKPEPPRAPAGTAGAAGAAGPQGRRKGERRYACVYCAWSGADNWCLKRHLNTHLKPFACALCPYRAARAERLHTHTAKVHHKRACARCPHLADDAAALQRHQRDAHQVEGRGLKVPAGGAAARAPAAGFAATQPEGADAGAGPAGGAAAGAGPAARRRAGAARLFGYLEASDGSGDEFDPPLEFAPPAPAPAPAPPQGLFARDKENAQPNPHIHHPMTHTNPHPHPHPHSHSHSMHDHCLRY